MSRSHRRPAGATLLVFAALSLLVATLVVGCGSQSDKYEGSWSQKDQPGIAPQPPIVIKKVGDQYSVTPPGAESQGYVLHYSPPGNGTGSLYSMTLTSATRATQSGDKLALSNAGNTIEIAVNGDTMTMTTQGVTYTFSRVKTN